MNCKLPDEFEVANSNLAELHGNGTHAPQKANKKPAPHSVPATCRDRCQPLFEKRLTDFRGGRLTPNFA